MSSSSVSSSSHSSHSSSSSRSRKNVSSSSRRVRASNRAAGVRGNRSGRYGAVRRQRCGPAASASAAVDAGGGAGLQKAAITLTEGANTQLSKMIAEMGDGVHYLRVGVKTGGCSGMSYVLDFDQEENVSGDDDSVMDVGVDKLLVVIANKVRCCLVEKHTTATCLCDIHAASSREFTESGRLSLSGYQYSPRSPFCIYTGSSSTTRRHSSMVASNSPTRTRRARAAAVRASGRSVPGDGILLACVLR